MKIQLIQGEFSPNDTYDLISKMLKIKIDYHESKINNTSNIEDIKYRETKIKALQNELLELRNIINNKSGFNVEAQVQIQ